MKIEAGSYYINGHDQIVGPLVHGGFGFFEGENHHGESFLFTKEGLAKYEIDIRTSDRGYDLIRKLPFGNAEELRVKEGDELYFMVWNDGETFEESDYKVDSRYYTVRGDRAVTEKSDFFMLGDNTKWLLLTSREEPAIVEVEKESEEEWFTAIGQFTPKADRPKTTYVFEVHFPKLNGHPDWSRAIVKGR